MKGCGWLKALIPLLLGRYCIAMEYVSGGSLWDALRAGKRGRVSFMGAALHVASAMEHMHVELGVLHRDLKSPNLLVSTDGVVKLSDFGLVCKESSENKAPEVGTFRWMAPEVVLFRPYGFPADVYSYGTVLWELLTSNIPFDGEQLFDGNAAQQRQGARKCAQENIRPKIPHGTPPRVRELILRCWHPLPEKRPDFGMITKELRAIDEELLPDERAFLAGDHLEGGVEAYAM